MTEQADKQEHFRQDDEACERMHVEERLRALCCTGRAASLGRRSCWWGATGAKVLGQDGVLQEQPGLCVGAASVMEERLSRGSFSPYSLSITLWVPREPGRAFFGTWGPRCSLKKASLCPAHGEDWLPGSVSGSVVYLGLDLTCRHCRSCPGERKERALWSAEAHLLGSRLS